MRVAIGRGREIVGFGPDNERFPAADLPDQLTNFLEIQAAIKAQVIRVER